MEKEKTNETAAAAVPNPMGMFGDMSLLREIIMGPKIIEYAEKHAELDATILRNDETTQALIQKNDGNTRARLDALERDMNARFDRLEKLLLQNVEQLTQKIASTSQLDKSKMSDLLIEMSQKLKD